MKQFFTKASLFIVCLLMTSSLIAQFTLTGNVSDGSGEELIGVSVIVKGTAIGTVTNFDGDYSLEVPGSSATVVYSYIGYSPVEQEVSSANGKVDIVMSDEASVLDEVVVTGLASSIKRSNAANAVAQISSKDLTGITNQTTMDGALYGKFKGAEIRSNSGAPGGGMSVKLRGVTSIFGNQQPLYIIDGIYVDNSSITLGTNIVSAAAGGGNTSTNQDDASNRIADIDPEDIETIEILKGASAAAIYGSRAAGGVVVISTKKGKAGKPMVRISEVVGFSSPTRLLGQRQFDRAKVLDNFGQDAADKFDANGITDYEDQLYNNTALASTTRLEFSGGSDQTHFFVGGTYKVEDGIVENTGYDRANLRFNLGHDFNDWLSVDLSNYYANSSADRGFFNNSNSNTTVGYALAFTQPWDNLFADENGNFPVISATGSNVLETVALTTNNESINRYIGGATATVRLFSNETNSLKLIARGGVDQYSLRTTGLFPKSLSYFRDPGSLGGASVSGATINKNYNLSAFLVHALYRGDISFRTQVGVTQENFDQNTVIATATGLNGSQTNIDQAANSAVFQNRILQQDKGFFAQEEFNWADRIIATVGIRGDKSSNNGDANKMYFYPKANIAFNIQNFDFWSVDALSTLKFRAAYGEAGRFANFNDRFNALNGTLIEGNSGLNTSSLRGNTTVGPERQRELEFGFDLGILKDKMTIDFTYYIKSMDDVLFRAQVPASSGYTTKVVNAGALENRGYEIGLNATPVSTGDFAWTTSVNFWKNNSKITRLDIPAFNTGGFAASLGQYRIQEGESATQIVGTINPDNCDNCDPDRDGFAVYGDQEADFNMGFLNGVSYKGLELTFLMHWKQGGDGINLSTLLWDLAGLTWDYDDTTLDPDGVMGNGDYRTSQWFAGNAGPWIEDASYFRLREVGLFYNIPRSVFNETCSMKVGVSGRNLINIFDYNSYDPEVSNFGGNVLGNAVEVTPFPTSKRINIHLSATF